MRRREFMGVLGLLPACATAGRPAARHTGPWSWEQIRAEFVLAPELAHMTSFFMASHPRAVREAVEAHRRAFDRDPFRYLEDNVVRYETALRRAAADYFVADPDDFAITNSTTMGLGLVHGGLVLKEGDEILSTTHDHAVTVQSVDLRAAKAGGKVNRVALYDDPARASADEIVDRFTRALTPRTRVAAVTWVHSGTGVKLPIRRLADVLARRSERTYLIVDGVHGVGLEDETPESLGCDFLIFGTHKWIFGPRGTGMVWGKRDAWPATAQILATMDGTWREGDRTQFPPAAYLTPGGFHPFEHRWAVAEAFRFHLEIGKARVAGRVHELNSMCKQALAKIPRVKVRTPMSPEMSAGIICFDIDGMAPDAVVERLLAKGIVASVTPPFYDPPHARVAPSLVTSEADVERTLAAIRSL